MLNSIYYSEQGGASYISRVLESELHPIYVRYIGCVGRSSDFRKSIYRFLDNRELRVYELPEELSALTANDTPGAQRPLSLAELRSTCILRHSEYSEGVSSDAAPAYHDTH